MGKQGGDKYRRKERKDLEVGVLKGQEAGEIEGNYTSLLNILQSKKKLKGGSQKRGPKQGLKGGRFSYQITVYNFIDE